MMKKFALCVALFLAAEAGMAQAPSPDVFYLFESATGTEIIDSSGNSRNARWYNYFGEDPGSPTTSTSSWRPSQGYRGGAAYLAGDHAFCPSNCPDPTQDCSCSSGTDLFLFSEDGSGTCEDGLVPTATTSFFHGDLNKFTVAFWFKNDWNYLCNPGIRRTCYLDTNDCAWERQVLFTMGGSTSGVTMAVEPGATQPALLRISAGGTGGTIVFAVDTVSAIWNKQWVHLAVVFDGDGAGAGTLRLVVNGVQRRSVTTTFGKMAIGDNSAVFGGENGQSVSGFNVFACWPDNDILNCGITQPYYNTLRYGWPARGWLDEFAYWKDVSLTNAELTEFASIGDTLTSNSRLTEQLPLTLAPSLNEGSFEVRGLPAGRTFDAVVINTMGQEVFTLPGVQDRQVLVMPGSFQNGMYFLRLTSQGRIVASDKFVIRK